MRVDGKQEGVRQANAWLHTWTGLGLGWLLYAIFLTGTLSFFHNEITTWMKPELHQSLTNQPRTQQLHVALARLQADAPTAAAWNIALPLERQTVTTVSVRAQGEDPRERRGGQRLTLDSATGEVIESRDTRGGGFLYRFHFELYGLERGPARWIVGIATFLMLVAIISGVITHKKIFKDFFTFRPNKGQRSWLDAHNAMAVFALPFHLMITFSGLLLVMFTIFPWGATEVFADRQAFLQAQNGGAFTQMQPRSGGQNGDHARGMDPRRESAAGRRAGEDRGAPAEVRSGMREMALREGRGVGRQSQNAPEKPIVQVPMTDLVALYQQAVTYWPNKSVVNIAINNPNTERADIEFRAAESDSLLAGRGGASLKFNAHTGARIETPGMPQAVSVPSAIYRWVTNLHMARGVDLGLRWILFLSGLLGTLMIATGLVMWIVKRIPEQQKRGRKSLGFRFVEVANVASIAGINIAIASYFYANRFISADSAERALTEIHVFFAVWLMCFVHALVRPHRAAWVEQLTLGALLFALLPLLNGLTGGRHLLSAIGHGQWVVASVDLMAMMMAVILGWAVYKLMRAPALKAARKSVPVNINRAVEPSL